MLRSMLAVAALVLLPACGSAVIEELATSSGSGGAGPDAGTGGASAASSAASSSAGAGGEGGSVVIPNPCGFTVSGAFSNTFDEAETIAQVGGFLECFGRVGGQNHVVELAFGPIHGPGHYVGTSYEGYQEYSCPSGGDGDCDVNNFSLPPGGMPCEVDLDMAPADPEVGDAISGTFSCALFVGDDDATSTVTIQSGWLSATLGPVPD